MKYDFPKSARLRTRRQYQRMHNGERHVGYWICIDILPNNKQETLLGITVTKKYGKAHERNRFKRIVREAFRLTRHKLPIGYHLNVKPTTEAHRAKTTDLIAELQKLLPIK